jgi:hypothetical protein
MKNIIKKCIDELNKENPKLDYVRGMLEVLFEQDTPPTPTFKPAIKLDASINPHGLPPENDGFKVLEK